MKWHIKIPYVPLLLFFLLQSRKWALVPLSYASASGAAKISQPRVKARERSDRAGGGGVGGGFPPPTAGRFVDNSCMKTAFS